MRTSYPRAATEPVFAIDRTAASSTHEFTPDELTRYSRQLLLPEVGDEGQRRLARSSVLIVAAGGLGSPTALYLAAAGVGRLGVIDSDRVELSNLHRQVLHDTASVGAPKVESARARLAALNPSVDVSVFPVRLSAKNVLRLVEPFDVVIDASDNFATRFLTNDACVLLRKPNVYGSILRFEGQVTTFAATGQPCYRCLFPERPPAGLVPSCAEGGVLGVLPGLVGCIQAAETLKILLGVGDVLDGRLLLVDAFTMRFREVRVRRNRDCPACGARAMQSIDPGDPHYAPEGCELPAKDHSDITAEELRSLLEMPDALQLVDVREPAEWQIARLPGARLIPLSSLQSSVSLLDPGLPTVVYCKRGARGRDAASILRGVGFAQVRNLMGGIDGWATAIDPSMPRY